MMVCMYFFNQAYTGFQIWFGYRQPFPWIHGWLLPCSILVVLDMNTMIAGSLMTAVAFFDALKILVTQLTVWYTHGYLYINELMVKKMSLLGAAILILVLNWKETSRRTSQVAGMLLDKAESVMSDKKSAVMLTGRLLISTLFLYVGVTEIQRQIEHLKSDGTVHKNRHSHDGHDSILPKLFEFALSIPFTVGFKSALTARCLAIVLIIEACTSWLWFTSQLNVGYRIHAREHFFVNIGVAGACILFAYIGAGKYSVDEFLKKTE